MGGQNVMLRSTFETIKKKVEELEEELRKIPGELSQAYDTGGQWHDNPGYDFALERQKLLNSQLGTLRDQLMGKILIEETKINPSQICIGTSVEAKKLTTQELRIFIFVGPCDVIYQKEQEGVALVSPESPIAKAFLSKRRGDIAFVRLPSGVESWDILNIKAIKDLI